MKEAEIKLLCLLRDGGPLVHPRRMLDAQAYALLCRLTNRDWVKREAGPEAPRGKRSPIFSITAKGLLLLERHFIGAFTDLEPIGPARSKTGAGSPSALRASPPESSQP